MPWTRIDTIERAIRRCALAAHAVGSVGYGVAYAVAEDNLRLGRSVVADGVSPLATTRAGWRAVAKRTAVAFVEVEVICSDAIEHGRWCRDGYSEHDGLTVPTWDEGMAQQYEPWTGEHVVIDTARRPVEEGVIEPMRCCSPVSAPRAEGRGVARSLQPLATPWA